MTAFWNAPVADILDRSNMIDDIAMEHALDRVTRMRRWTRDLKLQEVHPKGSKEAVGQDLRIVFGEAGGASVEIRVEGTRIQVWIFGKARNTAGFTSCSTHLIFPSHSIEGIEEPSTPAAIVEKWIETLSLPTTPLLGGIDDIDDDAPEQPFRRPLIDACAIIAAYNPDRVAARRIRMMAPVPGRRATLVDKSGRNLLRRECERSLVTAVPVPLRFDIGGIDTYMLAGIEFSVLLGSVPSDPLGVMRTLSERGLSPEYDPLLSAARRNA